MTEIKRHKIDRYYVSGCKDNGSDTVTCDDSEAQFWTLYVRDDAGLSQGIIDLAFREDAVAAMAVYVERDALQEQVRVLAAENLVIKSSVPSLKDIEFDNENMDDVSLGEDIGFNEAVELMKKCLGQTPATDATLREIRAQAIEALRDSISDIDNGIENTIDLHHYCTDFAASIRAGEQS